jgi:hypothetical protein
MRSPTAPERRSPRSITRELRLEAARVETAVALVLVLSILALVYVFAPDASAAARAAGGFA